MFARIKCLFIRRFAYQRLPYKSRIYVMTSTLYNVAVNGRVSNRPFRPLVCQHVSGRTIVPKPWIPLIFFIIKEQVRCDMYVMTWFLLNTRKYYILSVHHHHQLLTVLLDIGHPQCESYIGLMPIMSTLNMRVRRTEIFARPKLLSVDAAFSCASMGRTIPRPTGRQSVVKYCRNYHVQVAGRLAVRTSMVAPLNPILLLLLLNVLNNIFLTFCIFFQNTMYKVLAN